MPIFAQANRITKPSTPPVPSVPTFLAPHGFHGHSGPFQTQRIPLVTKLHLVTHLSAKLHFASLP